MVYAAVVLPVFIVAWSILWFDRERTNKESEAGAQTIERSWANESAATAFWALIGGSILMESLGTLFNFGWLSPLGLPHVLILGGLAFAGSYIYLKKTQG